MGKPSPDPDKLKWLIGLAESFHKQVDAGLEAGKTYGFCLLISELDIEEEKITDSWCFSNLHDLKAREVLLEHHLRSLKSQESHTYIKDHGKDEIERGDQT